MEKPPVELRGIKSFSVEGLAGMATIVSPTTTRVLNSQLAQKIMSADEAASLIKSGDQVGMSGFTGSGYPKAVPIELARHIADANFRGQKFQVSVFTGASTGPELDGALAMAGGIHLRLPYQSDPETRKRINAGEMDYMDIHLSHVAQFVEYGFLGKLNVALIEVTAVLEDGRLIPSSSIGNNKTWVDQAERVILEVNSWQPAALEGMHDIYYGLQPPLIAGRFLWCIRASELARRTWKFLPRRLPPSCSPILPTAIALSKRLMKLPSALPGTFWNF